MTTTAIAIEDLDQNIEIVEQHTDAPRQVKISLAADAPRPLRLTWNPGGRNGRTTTIVLEPGKSVVQPMFKAEAWLGPFTLPERFAASKNEQERNEYKKFWAIEKSRVLSQYDYPRPAAHFKDGIAPIGPHRFPDVTVTVLEADGTPNEPIRLHQLYKIGEFDQLYPPDSFGVVDTITASNADVDTLTRQLETERSEKLELAQRVARMEGMMQALVNQKKGAA